jgi:hypothetical protein
MGYTTGVLFPSKGRPYPKPTITTLQQMAGDFRTYKLEVSGV